MNYLIIVDFLRLLLIFVSITSAETQYNPCNLPDECHLVKPFEIYDRFPYTIKCLLNDDSDFDIARHSEVTTLPKNNQTCEIYKSDTFFIYFNLKNPFTTYILSNKRFNFANLNNYIHKIFTITKKRNAEIRFNHINGFYVNMLNSNDTKQQESKSTDQ